MERNLKTKEKHWKWSKIKGESQRKMYWQNSSHPRMLRGKVSPGKRIHSHALILILCSSNDLPTTVCPPETFPRETGIYRVDAQDKFLNKQKMDDHYNSGLTPLNFFTLYLCYLSVYKLQISFY